MACGIDANVHAYDIECDPDLNTFDTDDYQDITKAGMGAGGQELASNAGFLVFIGIMIFLLGAFVAMKTGLIKIGKY